MRRRRPEPFAATLAVVAACAGAQTPGTETVVIVGGGAERRAFDAPFAVTVVDADALSAAGPMVNLSEALARVPGLVVNNRNNYAQDLQINSRGFGARASFGVRGMRLYSDGIPAAGPDGQGQVSHFDIAGAERVEVLRGPFSALYGNSSGGVIALASAAPREREATVALDAGSAGLQQWRLGVAAPLDGGFNVRAQASRFDIDGFRPQSSARRTLGNVRLGWDGERDRVVAVLNAVDQPALDPLGLTPAQFAADPDQTTGVALPQAAPGQPFRFNTRKLVRQEQAGLSWRHALDHGALREAVLAAYSGRRSVTQWQSIPETTQLASPLQPGGVIDFDRDYGGLDLRLRWSWALGAARTAQLVAGTSVDTSVEDRRGFQNFVGDGAARVLGVTGALRRDERNRMSSRDVYAQGEAEFAADWTATLGVRSGRVKFGSADHYIVPGVNPADPPLNPDDSGSLAYRYTNPVAALQWRALADLNLYLSAGRGFESPTLTELAYRPDGQSGFNNDLKAQTSRQWELGAKWRPAAQGMALDVALFDARSRDEIGVASNVGGRTTFRNVGRTTRRGAELDLRWRATDTWRLQLAATWLDAVYADGAGVLAGNRIAGTQKASAYGEVQWRPVAGVALALEGRAQGRVPVNDANSVFAPGFGLLALRAQWQLALGPGTLDLLARVDNLADRRVVGSVIVNEGNGRFFEPAPGRSWLLGVRWGIGF